MATQVEILLKARDEATKQIQVAFATAENSLKQFNNTASKTGDTLAKSGKEVSKFNSYMKEGRMENRQFGFVMREVMDIVAGAALMIRLFGGNSGESEKQAKRLSESVMVGYIAFQFLETAISLTQVAMNTMRATTTATTIATEGLIVANTGLNTSLKGTPWGMIIAVLGAVGTAVYSYVASAEDAVEKTKKLADEIWGLQDSLINLSLSNAKLRFELGEITKKEMRDELILMVDIGKEAIKLKEQALDKIKNIKLEGETEQEHIIRILKGKEELQKAINDELKARKELAEFNKKDKKDFKIHIEVPIIDPKGLISTFKKGSEQIPEIAKVNLDKTTDWYATFNDEVLSGLRDKQLTETELINKHYDELLQTAKLVGASQSDIELLESQRRIEIAEKETEKKQQLFSQITDAMQQGLRMISAFENQEAEATISRLERERDVRLQFLTDQLNNEALSEEQRAELLARKEEIENQYQAKIKAEKQKQFETNKRVSIIEAMINTAVSVTKVLGTPWLAAVTAALGAAQVALIASQPTPEFHKGGTAFVNAPASQEGFLPIKVRGQETVRVTTEKQEMGNKVININFNSPVSDTQFITNSIKKVLKDTGLPITSVFTPSRNKLKVI